MFSFFVVVVSDVTADILAINASQVALREKGRALKIRLREIRDALSSTQLKVGCSVTCRDIGSYLIDTDIDYEQVGTSGNTDSKC